MAPEPAPGTAEVRAFVGLGSNLGDRLENLRTAVQLLDREPGIRVIRSSRVYETAPVGPPQPDYLNAVVEVRTTRSARGLLEACLEVEHRMGRIRGERWGPRLIDLDLLTYGTDDLAEPDLRIPHPRMHERGFVMVPLLELEADPPLPGGRRAAALRLPARTLADVRVYAPGLPVGPAAGPV